jgi:hypothetical protein
MPIPVIMSRPRSVSLQSNRDKRAHFVRDSFRLLFAATPLFPGSGSQPACQHESWGSHRFLGRNGNAVFAELPPSRLRAIRAEEWDPPAAPEGV